MKVKEIIREYSELRQLPELAPRLARQVKAGADLNTIINNEDLVNRLRVGSGLTSNQIRATIIRAVQDQIHINQIHEDVSAEEQLSGESNLSSNLLPVLMFLKKRSEDKELSAKLRTESLIQLVQNAGDTAFDYNALVDAFENVEAVKELIKSFNEDEVILKSDNDPDADEEHTGDDDETGASKDPQKTVQDMAKKARNNRAQ